MNHEMDCTHCHSKSTKVEVTFNSLANAVFTYCRRCEHREWLTSGSVVSVDEVVGHVYELTHSAAS